MPLDGTHCLSLSSPTSTPSVAIVTPQHQLQSSEKYGVYWKLPRDNIEHDRSLIICTQWYAICCIHFTFSVHKIARGLHYWESRVRTNVLIWDVMLVRYRFGNVKVAESTNVEWWFQECHSGSSMVVTTRTGPNVSKLQLILLNYPHIDGLDSISHQWQKGEWSELIQPYYTYKIAGYFWTTYMKIRFCLGAAMNLSVCPQWHQLHLKRLQMFYECPSRSPSYGQWGLS